MISKKQALGVIAVATGISAIPFAAAQHYPDKPVRIMVPYAPGGDSDATARLVASKLSEYLGQQFVIDNRGGASGTIGTETGVKATPDGYTLTLIGAGYPVNAALYPLTFDPVRDIAPIVQIAKGPFLLVVHPSLPVRTVDELIAYARARPGQINYANSGSTVFMATELFLNLAKLKVTGIPYKGTGPALIDTISGQTSIFFASIAAVLPHVKGGRLRGLALTTAKRIAAEPEIPTIAEAGIPGYDVPNWHGLIGPRGLPTEIRDRLHAEVSRALGSKDVQDLLQRNGTSPSGAHPEAFLAEIRREITLWRQVVKDSGIKMQL